MADTKLEKGRQAWEAETVEPTLARTPERRRRFETSSGVEIRRLYTPLDVDHLDYERDIGFPGRHPFTRGVQPTMYRGRLWTMRQYAGYGTAEDSNRRYHYLLSQGQTGLSIAFDLPTQMGRDSDHPLACGEVGRAGVAIDSLEDMEILLAGIPLDRVSTSMTINATAAILLALYLVVAEKQGVPWSRLNGTIQNDILKEYVARGTYIYPPAASLRIITDIFAFCRDQVPNWNTISISGYHIREAGATAAQEVAFTLANGIAYVEAALRAGLTIDHFAARLSFFFNVHNNFFEEVAKFRAARRLWAETMRTRFQAQMERSCMLRFHAQTAGSSLTAQQPDNNVVRVALQALAAVCGGAQSLHCNAKDEALALPSEEAALLALRTQQVIAHETGVTESVDPLGGSYLVEALTSDLEAAARQYLDRIEQMGGAVRAIEQGFMQREIQTAAYRYQKEIEQQERIIIGVNEFLLGEEPPVPILKIDPALEEEQRAKIAGLRTRRNAEPVERALRRIEEVARGDDNLMLPIIDAVRALATLGEISEALRRVWGEYRPPAGL